MESGIVQFIPLIVLITFVVIVVKLKNRGRQTRIEEKKEEEKRLKDEKKEEAEHLKEEKEKKIIKEEQRLATEEIKIEKDESSSDLGASLKRLKKMYNDGHISKVEFEKAKNKLLK